VKTTLNDQNSVLILGIGNVLMGDEGIGVRVVENLEKLRLPPGVGCLDGGTGSFQLLEPIQKASRVVLIDAMVSDDPPGTVHRLEPRFSKEYPPSLTAHDIGLKDLLDSLYLMGSPPPVTLLAVSIRPLQGLGTELSPELAEAVPEIARMVLAEL
jgi:hydrogenase maturation protease